MRPRRLSLSSYRKQSNQSSLHKEELVNKYLCSDGFSDESLPDFGVAEHVGCLNIIPLLLSEWIHTISEFVKCMK